MPTRLSQSPFFWDTERVPFLFLILLALGPSHVLAAKTQAKDASFLEGLDEMRVLIKRVRSTEQKEIFVEGQALSTTDGKVFRSRKVRCLLEHRLPSALMASTSKIFTKKQAVWACGGKPHQWTMDKTIAFQDRSGFVQFEGAWYRGTLKWLPIGDDIWVVNHIPMDDYIASLIHGEMPESFPFEALKAQATAARSYAVARALKRRRQNLVWDLRATPHDQFYPGAQKESRNSLKAAAQTRGHYLMSDGQVLKAYYSAASGGHSELPSTVWGRPDEDKHYKAKPNAWDKGHYKWEIKLSRGIAYAWQELGKLIDIRVLSLTPGKRVQELELIGSQRNVQLTTKQFSRQLKMGSFKSQKFEITKVPTGFRINGEGWGHGVGLSQIAAQQMAKKGKSYREILAFHYPTAEIVDFSPKIPVQAR